MMANVRSFLALVAAALSFLCAPAMAADDLDCVDSGYSTGDQARLDESARDFDLAAWGTKGPPADVMDIIVVRVRACATLHNWSDEAADNALAFKMARFCLEGSEQNGSLSAGHIAALRKSVTPEDMKRGKALFVEMSNATREGTSAPSDSLDMLVGRIILRSGVPVEKARLAGGWLGAIFMCAHFAALFDAA
jgi:hypothetical protein